MSQVGHYYQVHGMAVPGLRQRQRWWAQQRRLAEERRRHQLALQRIGDTDAAITTLPDASTWLVPSTICASQWVRTASWLLILLPIIPLGLAALVAILLQGATGALPFLAGAALLLLCGCWRLNEIWGGNKPRQGLICGIVGGLESRLEPAGPGNIERLTFRVERYDARGNRLAAVPVEMVGQRIKGTIRAGDQVEVKGRLLRRGALRVKRLYNATTRTTVRAFKKRCWHLNLIFFVILFLSFAAICAAINAGMASAAIY